MWAGFVPAGNLLAASALFHLNSITPLSLGDECMPSMMLLQANKAAQAVGDALPLGFHPAQRVLCVGEGNFSFARALARLFDGDGSCLVATAYDSEEQAQLKYEVSCDRRAACGTAPAWWWQGCLGQCREHLVGRSCALQPKYEVSWQPCLHINEQGLCCCSCTL